MGACEKTEGEARSGIEERVGNRPDRKKSLSVIQPNREAKRKKREAGAGQLEPEPKEAGKTGID